MPRMARGLAAGRLVAALGIACILMATCSAAPIPREPPEPVAPYAPAAATNPSRIARGTRARTRGLFKYVKSKKFRNLAQDQYDKAKKGFTALRANADGEICTHFNEGTCSQYQFGGVELHACGDVCAVSTAACAEKWTERVFGIVDVAISVVTLGKWGAAKAGVKAAAKGVTASIKAGTAVKDGIRAATSVVRHSVKLFRGKLNALVRKTSKDVAKAVKKELLKRGKQIFEDGIKGKVMDYYAEHKGNIQEVITAVSADLMMRDLKKDAQKDPADGVLDVLEYVDITGVTGLVKSFLPGDKCSEVASKVVSLVPNGTQVPDKYAACRNYPYTTQADKKDSFEQGCINWHNLEYDAAGHVKFAFLDEIQAGVSTHRSLCEAECRDPLDTVPDVEACLKGCSWMHCADKWSIQRGCWGFTDSLAGTNTYQIPWVPPKSHTDTPIMFGGSDSYTPSYRHINCHEYPYWNGQTPDVNWQNGCSNFVEHGAEEAKRRCSNNLLCKKGVEYMECKGEYATKRGCGLSSPGFKSGTDAPVMEASPRFANCVTYPYRGSAEQQRFRQGCDEYYNLPGPKSRAACDRKCWQRTNNGLSSSTLYDACQWGCRYMHCAEGDKWARQRGCAISDGVSFVQKHPFDTPIDSRYLPTSCTKGSETGWTSKYYNFQQGQTVPAIGILQGMNPSAVVLEKELAHRSTWGIWKPSPPKLQASAMANYFSFLFDDCPRGAAVSTATMRGNMPRSKCEALCDADVRCNAYEVSGCLAGSDCGGKCVTFAGSGGVSDITPSGETVCTGADTKTYLKQVRSSSSVEIATRPASNLVDGHTETQGFQGTKLWTSQSNSNEWVAFDMGRDASLAGLKLWANPANDWARNRLPKTVKVETSSSPDGPWVTVETFTTAKPSPGPQAVIHWHKLQLPARTRYVRLMFADNHGDRHAMELVEVEFFGVLADTGARHFTPGCQDGVCIPDTIPFTDNYASHHTTAFTARKTGVHTFRTISDDGSKLFVSSELDGRTEVVNNDGLHAMRLLTGTIALTAGKTYRIDVVFFERYGGAGLQVDYLEPGSSDWHPLSGCARFEHVPQSFQPSHCNGMPWFNVYGGAPTETGRGDYYNAAPHGLSNSPYLVRTAKCRDGRQWQALKWSGWYAPPPYNDDKLNNDLYPLEKCGATWYSKQTGAQDTYFREVPC